jgi:GMP synthase (glutamine-hydrolysing)
VFVAELNVYCELHSCLVDAAVLAAFGTKLKGVILSGGPFSVYEEGAPHVQVLEDICSTQFV